MAASPGLGTPAKAGPPRAVSLKLRISLSDLLSSTLVFANYPLRTKILVLAMTSAPQQKKPPFQVDFFAGWQDSSKQERKSAQLYRVLVNHRSEILEMKEQVQMIKSFLAA